MVDVIKSKSKVGTIDIYKSSVAVMMIFISSIICSSLYAVYLFRTNSLPQVEIAQYLTNRGMNFRNFMPIFLMYAKRCLIIWVCGFAGFLVPLSFVFSFIYMFSYGFSITLLIITYGSYGLKLCATSFLAQGIVMIAVFIYLLVRISEYNDETNMRKARFHLESLKLPIAACIGIALLECIF